DAVAARVVLGVGGGVVELQAAALRHADSLLAAVADQAALDDAADAAALGVDAVGGDVVDVAVLHQHGVAVDIVDALGVAGVAQAGIVDFAASDGDVVRAGDLHAVAAGAVDDAVLH